MINMCHISYFYNRAGHQQAVFAGYQQYHSKSRNEVQCLALVYRTKLLQKVFASNHSKMLPHIKKQCKYDAEFMN